MKNSEQTANQSDVVELPKRRKNPLLKFGILVVRGMQWAVQVAV
jgi:hypothetical protein